MTKLVRTEHCAPCGCEIPIFQYAPYNDDGRTMVTAPNGDRVPIETRCWNRLVNYHIWFGPSGWMWDGVKFEDTRWNQYGDTGRWFLQHRDNQENIWIDSDYRNEVL